MISFRIRRSTGTADREAAEEYHDRLKAELWRVRRFGERSRHSWQEAAVKWLQETPHKATHDKDREILRWLDPYLSGKTLDKIDRELLLKIGEVKVKETSPATTNRYLALVRAILRKARDEWDWLERVPKIRFYVVRNKRIRWLRWARSTAPRGQAGCLPRTGELPGCAIRRRIIDLISGIMLRSV